MKRGLFNIPTPLLPSAAAVGSYTAVSDLIASHHHIHSACQPQTKPSTNIHHNNIMPWQPPKQEKCERCGRSVYAAERMEAGKKIWHTMCFRCGVCDMKLTLNNYCQDAGTLFCKNHFQEFITSKNAQITT